MVLFCDKMFSAILLLLYRNEKQVKLVHIFNQKIGIILKQSEQEIQTHSHKTNIKLFYKHKIEFIVLFEESGCKNKQCILNKKCLIELNI